MKFINETKQVSMLHSYLAHRCLWGDVDAFEYVAPK